MSLYQIDNVSKFYKKSAILVKAIQDLSLTISQGEFIVVLGKSGSGKSTLLSLLAGLEKTTSGNITFNDEVLQSKSEDELAIMRRKNIGIIFQHFNLLDSMTAFDNIELPLIIARKPREARRNWVEFVLSKVGLRGRASHYPNELSGGERQRIGIARALANKPNVIIADEPTGDLDTTKGVEIMELLYHLNQNKSGDDLLDWRPTIILVTHDVGLLREGMRVIVLSDGKIIRDRIFENNPEDFEFL